jgi:hypothetical protein
MVLPVPASRSSGGRRLGTRAGLRVAAAVTVVVIGAVGLTVALGTSAQDDAVGHALASAEPLGVTARDIYRDLSDADAVAAQIFLAGAQADVADQRRYDSDLQQVSSGLAAVSADAPSAPVLRPAVGELVADLPVYTRLVGTALADGRQNLPIGAAYLREASKLLRTSLLPAARHAMAAETGRLGGDDGTAAADPPTRRSSSPSSCSAWRPWPRSRSFCSGARTV